MGDDRLPSGTVHGSDDLTRVEVQSMARELEKQVGGVCEGAKARVTDILEIVQ
jgi:hypothetical protein